MCGIFNTAYRIFPCTAIGFSRRSVFVGKKGCRAFRLRSGPVAKGARTRRKRTQPRCGRGIGDAVVIQGSRYSATLRYVTQPPWGWECVAPGCYETGLWPFEEIYPGILVRQAGKMKLPGSGKIDRKGLSDGAFTAAVDEGCNFGRHLHLLHQRRPTQDNCRESLINNVR